MTENRRIALNVISTYGRSLYALAVGLFTGRWILMALGETDYGLYGVVGGLMAFVTFLNGLMAQAVSRFYAFSVGQARTAATAREGVEECQRWFSVAVLVHTVLPVVLVSAGYPAGVWAIENFLTIPPDRVSDCLWVWRFTCLSGFIAMVNVPFAAMYNAKQEIAELTIYSFVTTTLNVCFAYYMVAHPGVWLAKYAVWMSVLSVVPALVIGVRAVVKYPECRIRRDALRDGGRLSRLFAFAGSRAVNAFSSLVSGNGMAIVVNKYLGPAKNVAMSLGNTMSGRAASLSASLCGAFQPAITTAAGEGDFDKMRRLVFCTCRFSTAAVMVFSLPLLLEIDEVTRLWLKNPPDGVTLIASFMLVDLMLQRVSEGHWIAIFATGRILRFQLVESLFFLAQFALAWGLIALGWGLLSIGLAVVVTGGCAVFNKVWFARRQCGLSARRWLTSVVFPLLLSAAAALLAGLVPKILLAASPLRVVVTATAVEAVLLPILWRAVLSADEKQVVRMKLSCLLKMKGGV